MIPRLSGQWHRFVRWFNRAYWAVRLFGLSKPENHSGEPGLIMIQIDGLSGPEFQRALAEGHLPFLRDLIKKENYEQHTFYSGLPSATPAVQGELFYGIKGCTPAFHFKDKQTGRVFIMYDRKAASEIEQRLKSSGNPALLEGGSSYSNIFCGGAAEAHFCAAGFDWKSLLSPVNPMNWVVLVFFHPDIFIRTLVLLIFEFVIALFDGMRGAFAKGQFWLEMGFVPLRVFVSIFLRELIVLGTSIDIARGLPIIHVNFFGYDEQSHRRSPTSGFAHWSLQGIDFAIARIWKQASRAERRDYEVWIYSDHGQERTLPYPVEHGRRIEEVVAKIFGEVSQPDQKPDQAKGCCTGIFCQLPQALPKNVTEDTCVLVTGMGPLMHVYPPREVPQETMEGIIRELIETAKVPLVLFPHENGQVKAHTLSGVYTLPAQAASILGESHPFLHEAAEDLVALCRHPNAGKIILSGWLTGHNPITFPVENGSHAGFGPNETNAFCLLPSDVILPHSKRRYLRPTDLRLAALNFMGRIPEEITAKKIREPKKFRLMTYNVHGCMGMDGKISPQRIARVISRHDLDVVALQEMDVGRLRSGGVDQVELIARKLNMSFHFHPSFCIEDEKYGNAVLSRHPMKLVKAGPLPQRYRRGSEPRGVLWVEIDVDGKKIQLLNTHLSIWRAERLLQAETILGDQWLGHPDCANAPIIFCGDLNASPKSAVIRRAARYLKDAQMKLEGHRPLKTYLPFYPLSRIDHVFVKSETKVTGVRVPRARLERLSSDHLPLIVEIEI